MTLTKKKIEYNDRMIELSIDYIRENADGTYKVVGYAQSLDPNDYSEMDVATINSEFLEGLNDADYLTVNWLQKYHVMRGFLCKEIDEKTFEFDLEDFQATMHAAFVDFVRSERLFVITEDKYIEKYSANTHQHNPAFYTVTPAYFNETDAQAFKAIHEYLNKKEEK